MKDLLVERSSSCSVLVSSFVSVSRLLKIFKFRAGQFALLSRKNVHRKTAWSHDGWPRRRLNYTRERITVNRRIRSHLVYFGISLEVSLESSRSLLSVRFVPLKISKQWRFGNRDRTSRENDEYYSIDLATFVNVTSNLSFLKLHVRRHSTILRF